ncbi:uncharacterized protein LOC125619208 [Marmota marmota marmota]|uniref:uncharacterized protein LOC125619208 n=1 Tax=Marmota marmota marmota TaxID=9994 RepID=UPI00209378A5|nr:uncharacterized protein LOC125619208 [Marmota marmota marmota]
MTRGQVAKWGWRRPRAPGHMVIFPQVQNHVKINPGLQCAPRNRPAHRRTRRPLSAVSFTVAPAGGSQDLQQGEGTQQARPPQDLCMCCASVFFSRSSQNSALGIGLHSSLPGLPALLREHPVHFMVFHIDTDAGLLMGLPEDRHQMPLDGPQPPGPSLLSTSCQLTLRHAGWIVTLRCPLTSLTPTPWEQTDPLATWRTPQRLPGSGVQGLRAHRPGAQPLLAWGDACTQAPVCHYHCDLGTCLLSPEAQAPTHHAGLFTGHRRPPGPW